MGKPIIIDDGGSIRLKRLVEFGTGAMDGLMDVDFLLEKPLSHAVVEGPFNRVKVTRVDNTGGGQTVLNAQLWPGDQITVKTNNGQHVIFTIDDHSDGLIQLLGADGAIPLVEAKQFKGKRRYVVSNAGSITTVTCTIGARFDPFDAEAGQSIYTSVAILTADMAGAVQM